MPTTLLPVRITPHALLETLVEVSYTPRTAPELALGTFHHVLQPDFKYERQLMGLFDQGTSQTEALFQGQGVLLRVRSGSLVFNCLEGEYLGWNKYFSIIQQVIRRLHATKEIADFPQISVRYINALPGVLLNEQLQVKLPPLGGLPSPESTQYRATIVADDFRIVLNLADNQRVPGRTGVRSVFDISVRAKTTTSDLDSLFQRLDQAHAREKEVFFGLLDPAYLDSLQPEYE